MSPPEPSTNPANQAGEATTAPPKTYEELTSSQSPAAGSEIPSATTGAGNMHQPEAHASAADAAGADAETQAPAKLVDVEDEASTGSPAAPAAASSTSPEAQEAKSSTAAEKQPELINLADEAPKAFGSSSLAARRENTPSEVNTSSLLLTAEQPSYIDPTPQTPVASRPPSRTPSAARSSHSHNSNEHSPLRSDPDEDKRYASDDDREGNSRSEIQSIMQQFSEFGGGPGAEEVMSPRLEIAAPMLAAPIQYPPRKSSLEPLSPIIAGQIQEFAALSMTNSSPAAAQSKEWVSDDQGPPVPPKDGAHGAQPRSKEELVSDVGSPSSPVMHMHRPPPPEPEPEPVLPFDFHRFLEQLRNKKADPVARYLKSFLSEFAKRQWMVHEQVKIISDFLAFIANKMMLCEVWSEVSDAEFDNAREGMEKLVMNRLYTQTFSPAIPPPKPIPGAKPKKKGGDPPLGPGRRGQHQEDVERDDIVTQKIMIYGWVKEEHLDIPPVEDSGRRFLKLAQQELLKIKSYRAPRDKIICVLNCCKVIFGLLKHSKSDSSADSFMPLLIYILLQSNPEHLVSNLQYVLRFRNQEKLGGEAGYYLSSLMGAVHFIENMDRTSLTITDDEFEHNVEAAVSAIAEKHKSMSPVVSQQATFSEKVPFGMGEAGQSATAPGDGVSPRQSLEGDSNNENPAITTLLKSFQRPLTTIGRMFSEEPGASSEQDNAPRTSHAPNRSLAPTSGDTAGERSSRPSSRHTLSAEEAAARQASAETAEAQKLQRAEHANVVETLSGMFPDLDKEVISDVVYQKEGRVGLAVDACLALST